MISFSIVCENDHDFEAWFRNGDDFDAQRRRKLIGCPACGSTKVEKALMAPAVSTGRRKEKMALAIGTEQRKAMAKLKELTEKLKQGADYVGDKFADEARKIHFGETEARGIYGEATVEEARSLHEDGVEFLPLPNVPDEQN